MLKGISPSTEEFQIINHGNLIILLEHENNFCIPLLESDTKGIFREKLVQMRQTIESYFEALLRSWDGNSKYFELVIIFIENTFV
jgi:hypothetical protein